MKFEFDTAKDEVNIAKHGVDVALVEAFEFDTAQMMTDNRHNYSETRTVAVGYRGPARTS